MFVGRSLTVEFYVPLKHFSSLAANLTLPSSSLFVRNKSDTRGPKFRSWLVVNWAELGYKSGQLEQWPDKASACPHGNSRDFPLRPLHRSLQSFS